MQPWFSKNISLAAVGLFGCAVLSAPPSVQAQVIVIQPSDSTGAGGRSRKLSVRDSKSDFGVTINIDDYDSSSGIVRFGEDIVIRPGEEVSGDVVAIGGSIESAGIILGDCVAIGGTVHIVEGGEVRGDAVGIGGSLTLDPEVTVRGDAVSVWGRLKKDSTSHVMGDVVQVGGIGPMAWTGNWGLHTGFWHVSNVARRLIWVGILIGLGALLFQVFPGQMTHLTETIHDAGIKAFLWGLLFWILWLPVVIALVITVIGIVAALGLIFLTPLIMLLGYLAAAKALGMRLSGGGTDTFKAYLVGLLALEGGVLVARMMGVGGPLGFIAMLICIIACTAIFLALTTGVGALMMTRFRSRPKGGVPAPATGPDSPPAESATTA